MLFVFKHFYLLFIVVNFINASIYRKRSKKYIEEDPSLEEGYRKVIKGFLIYFNIPWVIMAVGDVSGLTDGLWNYFQPWTLNPMVLAFHIYIIVLWVLASNWIYFNDGAAFISKYRILKFHGPGIQKDVTNTTIIKIFWTVCLLGGIAGMTAMWLVKIPSFPG